MLLKKLTIAIVFSMLATIVGASPAILKSGEHASFSRVTINGKNLQSWETQQSGSKFTIRFPSFLETFDTSQTFNRISRDRIQGLEIEGRELIFDLACPCSVEVYAAGPELVVIDVVDHSIAEIAQFLEPIPASPTQAFKYPMAFRENSQPGNTTLTIRPFKLLFPKLAIAMQDQRRQSLLSAEFEHAQHIHPKLATAQQKKLVRDLQDHLSSDFGRASTHGFLTSYFKPNLNNEDAASRSNLEPSFEVLESLSTNISVTSPIELTQLLLEKASQENHNKQCKSILKFDFRAWSNTSFFDQQLSTAKVALYDTLGNLDNDAAVELAKLYIARGLGAEAKQVLKLSQKLQDGWPELQMIADVLESKVASPSIGFKQSSKCPNTSVLWSALAVENSASAFQRESKLILLELSNLPIQLRRAIAPTISKRFLDAYKPQEAKAALETLRRTEQTPSEQFNLEDAKLLAFHDKPDDAIETLSSIVSNSEASAKAFIKKTRLEISAGKQVEIASMELLEGYNVEYAGTAIGAESKTVSILALSKAGMYRRALGRISAIPTEIRTQTLKEIYRDIVTSSTSVEFITMAFRKLNKEVLETNPELSLQYSVRLLELGFIDQAERYWNIPFEKKPKDAFDLVAARISIAQEQPVNASILLDNLQGKQAELLRAKIYELQDKNAKAAEIYLKYTDEERGSRNDFLATKWQETFSDSDSLVGQLARASQRELPNLDETDETLSTIREIMEESGATRGVISEVVFAENLSLIRQ